MHVRPGQAAAQVRHAHHVAVGIVLVGLDLRRVGAVRVQRGAGEAVAGLERRAAAAVFDQAGFEVVVGARPARMRRVAAAVLHLQEVADGVVHVALDVRAHGVAVAGMVEPGVEGVEGVAATSADCGCAIGLPQVFAAVGLDQPVEGVVGVVVARLDALVPEVDGLLRVVLDVGDVAGRVVGVVQVLHLAAGPAGDRAAAGRRRGRRPRCAG